MDNQNNNDFMSIFNDNHVDPNTVQNNIPDNVQDVQEEKQKFITINPEQINEQIVEQSEILEDSSQIDNSFHEETPVKEEKKSEPISYLPVLVFSLIFGLLIFIGITVAEKVLSSPKDTKRINELTEKAYNFTMSFDAYVERKNITNTISCTANIEEPSWHSSTESSLTENCDKLISEYKLGASSVEVPLYGSLVLDKNGIKNGTYFVYDEYTCTYNKNEEKLFNCEKTE